jgi:hypothetical protein
VPAPDVTAPTLAAFHLREIGKEELSALLGPQAVELFYRELLGSEDARVFFSTAEDGEILSLCCVLSDYPAFQRRMQRRLLPLVAKSLLKGRISLRQLLAERARAAEPVPESFRRFHLGMHIARSGSGPEGIARLMADTRKGLAWLREQGADRVWGRTRKENTAAHAFAVRLLGFQVLAEQADVVFFEKNLD